MMKPPRKYYEQAKNQYPHLSEAQIEDIAWAAYRRELIVQQETNPTRTFLGWDNHGKPLPIPTGDVHGRLRRPRRTIDVEPGSTPPRRFRVNVPLADAPYTVSRTTPIGAQDAIQTVKASVAADIVYSEKAWDIIRANQPAVEATVRRPTPFVKKLVGEYKKRNQISANQAVVDIWRSLIPASETKGAQKALQNYMRMMQAIQENPETPLYFFDTESAPVGGRQIISEITFGRYRFENGRFVKADDAATLLVGMTQEEAQAARAWVEDLRKSGRRVEGEESAALNRFIKYAGAVLDENGNIVRYGEPGQIPDFDKALAGIERLTLGSKKALPGLLDPKAAAKQVAKLTRSINEQGGFFVATNSYIFDEPNLRAWAERFGAKLPQFENSVDLLALLRTTVPDPAKTLHSNRALTHGPLAMDAFRETLSAIPEFNTEGLAHSAGADVEFLAQVFNFVHQQTNLHQTILDANRPKNPVNTLFSFDNRSLKPGDMLVGVEGMFAGEHDLVFDLETGEQVDWFREGAIATRTHYELKGFYYDPNAKQYRAVLHNLEDDLLHIISAPDEATLADRFHRSFEWVRPNRVRQLSMLRSHQEDRARRFYLRMHSELKSQQFDRLEYLYAQFAKLTPADVKVIQRQLWDERISTGQTVREFLADVWKYKTPSGKWQPTREKSMVYLTYLAHRLRGEAKYFNEAINKIRSNLSDPKQNFERMQALAMFYRQLNERYPLRSQRRLMFFERHQVEIDGRMVNLGSKIRIGNAVRSIIKANAPDSSPLYETMRENAFYSLIERLQEPIYGAGAEKVALLDANEALNIIGNREAKEPLAYKVNRLVNTLYGKRSQFTMKTIEAEGINRVHRVKMAEIQAMADEAAGFIKHRERNYRTKGGFKRDDSGHLLGTSYDYGPLEPYLKRMEAEGIRARDALDDLISTITGYKDAESEARVYLFEHGEGRFGVGVAFFDRSKRNIVEGILPTDDLGERLSTIGADYFNLGTIDINQHTWIFKNMRRSMRSHYVPTNNLVNLVAEAVAKNRLQDFTDPYKLMGMVRREDSFQYVLRRAKMIRDSYIQARKQYGWGSREAKARVMDALGRVFNELSDTTSQRGSLTMADRGAPHMHQFEDLAKLMRLHDEAVKMMRETGQVDAQKLADLAQRLQEEKEPYISAADQARYMKTFQEVFQDDEAVAHLRRYRIDEQGNKTPDNKYLHGFVSESQAARWMLTDLNPRDTVPTSETDPNARGHIEQMKRTLPLDPNAKPGPNAYMRRGSLWMTESGWQQHRRAGYNDSVLMKIAVIDETAVISRLRPELYEGRTDAVSLRALEDARRRIEHLKAEGLTVEDVLPFISTHEQHMGVRESAAEGLKALFVREESIHLSQGEEITGILLQHYNPKTGKFTPFEVNEDIEVSRFTGLDRREHRGLTLRAGTRVVGARMESGDLILSLEEDREFRMGAKGVFGDKGTMHRWKDRVFDILYGDWDEKEGRYIARFDMTGNFNVMKHQDYSMLLRGMVDDALDNVNRLMEQGKIGREEARQKVEQIADRLAETLRWNRDSIQVITEDFDGLFRLVTPDRLAKLENGRGGYRVRDVRALLRWLSREGLLTKSQIGDVIAVEGGPGRQSDTLRNRATWEDEGGARFGRRELEALDNWGNMERTIAAIKGQMQEETLRGRLAARSYSDSLVSLAGVPVEREAPVVKISSLRPIRAERLDANSLYNTIINPVVDGKEMLAEHIRRLDELDTQLRQGLITLDQRDAAAMAMPSGYWLEFDDLVVDGQSVIPQKRIFVPITQTLEYPGNKQLTEVQHALRQLHRSYYDLLTMYGHHPNEPTPMKKNRPLTRQEALQDFHQAFKNLQEKLSWELSAKEGQAAKNLSVRMLSSGRGQVAMLSPALTAQFELEDGKPTLSPGLVKAIQEKEGPKAQQIIADLNRQIKEAAQLAGGIPFREGDIYMTEGKFLAMIGDDAEGRALLGAIRRGEDVYGLNVRYPTFHDEALALGRIRIFSEEQLTKLGIDRNDARFFATPGTMARLRGDTDGDEISIWIAKNRQIQAEWREAMASDRYQYALYKAVMKAREQYTEMGDRSYRNRIFTTFRSLIRRGQEFIQEAAGLSDSAIEERLQKKYVGIISNLGFDLRENTKAVFGYDSDTYRAVAKITDVFEQKGISAKHNRSDRPMGEILLDAMAGGERARRAWEEMLDENGENVLNITRQQWDLFQKARDNFAERNIAFKIFREKGLSEDDLLGIILGTNQEAIALPRVQQVLEQLGRYGALENLKSAKVAAAETSLQRHGIGLTVTRAGRAKEQQRRELAQAATQGMAGSPAKIDQLPIPSSERPTTNLRMNVFRGESRESFFEAAGRNFSRIGGRGGALMGLAALAAVGFAASVVASPRTRAPLLPENTISLKDAPPPEPPSSYPSDQRSMYLEQNEPEGYELRIRGRSKGGEPIGQMVSQTLSDTGHSGSIHITERDDTTTLTNEWVRSMVAGLLGR